MMGRRKTEREGLPSSLSPSPSSSRLIALLFNRRRDNWGQDHATSGHSTADETKRVTCLAGSPSLLDQRFSLQTLWLAQLAQLGQGKIIRACASAVLDNQSMRFPFKHGQGDSHIK